MTDNRLIKMTGPCKRVNETAKLRTIARMQQAVDLRLAHPSWSCQRIGEEIGVSSSSAHRYLTRALELRTAEVRQAAHILRELELRRIGRILEKFQPQAENGCVQSAAVVLKYLQERAKLLGLYAPTRQEISGPGGGPVQLSDADLATKLGALAASIREQGRNGGTGQTNE